MINRFSQLKQTISEEFQVAQQQRPSDDPIAIIERNAHLMRTKSPEVESIVHGLDDDLAEPKKDDVKAELQSPEDGQSTEQSQVQSDNEAEKTNKVQRNDTGHAKNVPSLKDPGASKADDNNPYRSLSKEPVLEGSPEVNETNSPSQQDTFQSDASLQAKLTKFAKYEEKYPQLLKAYKLEKKKGELIRIYEKVLSENTPCTSIAEPRVLIDYLNDLTSKSSIQQKELNRVQGELEAYKKSKNQLKSTLSIVQAELKSSQEELAQAKAELRALEQKFANQEQTALKASQNFQQEEELKSRLGVLQTQLDAAIQTREAASKSQATLRSQIKELEIRLQEALSGSEILRDELREAERVSQERLHELSTVRSQLFSQEKGRRKSADESATLHSKTVVEKEQLEVDVELLNKRIIRESEQLTLQIRGLKSQLQESEAHEAELRKQLAHMQSLHTEPNSSARSAATSAVDLGSWASPRNRGPSTSRDDLGTSESVELAESRETIAVTSKANELLKKVNQDNALRIEKLQRSQRALALDLEQLRHENFLLKKKGRRGSLASVVSSNDPNSEDSEKHQAYLKNVILGFVENKGQRKALMPVIATLLGLEDREIDRFMKEFS